jgi:large subunit ribosomal protein L18
MKISAELRKRRKIRQRFKLSKTVKGRHRLLVHRTNRHIYAQILYDSSVVVSASTLSGEAKSVITNGGNKNAAAYVGKNVADKAKAKGITSVVFDRSGFLYHGRVKVLADAARENGLSF